MEWIRDRLHIPVKPHSHSGNKPHIECAACPDFAVPRFQEACSLHLVLVDRAPTDPPGLLKFFARSLELVIDR